MVACSSEYPALHTPTSMTRWRTFMRRVLPPALLLLFALARPAPAEVRPHALFTDGMVLQQGVRCPVWGTAAADEEVTVSLDAKDQGISFESKAKSDNGAWRVELPVLKAGGPYTLTLKGKNTVTVKDVLVGEVWVASGQSNMWWTIDLSET